MELKEGLEGFPAQRLAMAFKGSFSEVETRRSQLENLEEERPSQDTGLSYSWSEDKGLVVRMQEENVKPKKVEVLISF